MAHECEQCGQECYCDMDDCGGLPQPSSCPHLNGECDATEELDDFDTGMELDWAHGYGRGQ